MTEGGPRIAGESRRTVDGNQRIGVLLAHFNDSFQRDLWKAVRHRARGRGVSTVAFLGHGLDEPQLRHRTSTQLYQLARGPLLDGLIVFSHNVGTHSGPEAVSRLISTLGLPAVSIGFPLPGVPSVWSVSREAVRALVAHLVTVHGRRSFALVTGPELQTESKDREQAVREELAAQGLILDARLVVEGQFSRELAVTAAESLFSQGLPIDTVVCLNDHMAVGVLDFLKRQRVQVPEEVSVVGFDDLPESQWRRPSLTTIQQPLEPMGFRAVDLLLSPWATDHLPHVFDCTMVVRRSCGCAMATRAVSEKEVEDNLDQSDRFTWLRELGVSLQGAFDWDSLATQWALALESLGFTAGDVVLYDGPLHRTIRWSLAEGLRQSNELEGTLVLPEDSGQSADWIVLPLVYQDEFLGYIVLRCDLDDTLVYETLRDQMSTAVKATVLMEATFSHQRELERQVDRRTKELRAANRSLTDQIRQRRELEHVVQEVSNRTMQAIGQDIHDDLCQHLAGIGMLASVLEERWDARHPEEVQPLREIRGLLDKAVDRARQYSRTLYPPGLEQHGLSAALGDLVDNFRQTAPHLQVALQIEGEDFEADPQARLQLYRIAQELVANAVKHSGSELILVRLIEDADDWTLEVRDFGKGLVASVPPDRMGMQILQFRADSVGATLVFQNLDPGLRASCRLPKRSRT